MKKTHKNKDQLFIQQRLKEGSLSPKTKQLLESLSKELGLSEENLASLCVMMYRLYGHKV